MTTPIVLFCITALGLSFTWIHSYLRLQEAKRLLRHTNELYAEMINENFKPQLTPNYYYVSHREGAYEVCAEYGSGQMRLFMTVRRFGYKKKEGTEGARSAAYELLQQLRAEK